MNKTLLATLLFAPLLASAAAPSFDCTKASGSVETLICKDAGLAALDNELAALYPKAIAALSPEQLKTERAITTSHAFELPNAETFVGLKNYIYGIQEMDFLSSFWYSLVITVSSVGVRHEHLSSPDPGVGQ